MELLNTKGQELGKFVAMSMLAVVVGLGISPIKARADHPVAVAVIGGTALLGAAAITAAGTVAAAVIVAGATVYTSSSDEGDDDQKSSGGSTRSGTEDGVHKAKLGEADLPKNVRSFLDRDVLMTAGRTTAANGDQKVFAKAEYTLDGDIKLTPTHYKYFNVDDGLTFRFDVANVVSTDNAKLLFTAQQLGLSTDDIPETLGHVELSFVATQDGKPLWTWQVRVDQGKPPVVTGLDNIKIDAELDEAGHVLIHDVEIPIPYAAPGKGNSTRVEVNVKVDAQGART